LGLWGWDVRFNSIFVGSIRFAVDSFGVNGGPRRHPGSKGIRARWHDIGRFGVSAQQAKALWTGGGGAAPGNSASCTRRLLSNDLFVCFF
jgi:hypothetical protein